MFKIDCKELTLRHGSGQAGEECDFVAEGETKEKVKEVFYTHGEESGLHKEAYESASLHEANDFGKKIDDYLANQG